MALLKTVLLLLACVFSTKSQDQYYLQSEYRHLTEQEKAASKVYEEICNKMYLDLSSELDCKDACKFQSLALMDNDGSMNNQFYLILKKEFETEVNKVISEGTDKILGELEKEKDGDKPVKHYKERFICKFGEYMREKFGHRLTGLLGVDWID